MFFRFLPNIDSLVNPAMECGCRDVEDPGDNPVILVLVKEPYSQLPKIQGIHVLNYSNIKNERVDRTVRFWSSDECRRIRQHSILQMKVYNHFFMKRVKRDGKYPYLRRVVQNSNMFQKRPLLLQNHPQEPYRNGYRWLPHAVSCANIMLVSSILIIYVQIF
jgi:hypothetical protein